MKDFEFFDRYSILAQTIGISMHTLSQSRCNSRAWSMMYNEKSRHIRHRHDTVRKLLSSGIIIIDYVKSKDNVSNPLTKSPN